MPTAKGSGGRRRFDPALLPNEPVKITSMLAPPPPRRPITTEQPARRRAQSYALSTSVGRALGVMNPLHIPITATSAPLAGYISDTTGSYDGVFWLYGGCCALAAIGLTIMGSVLRSPNYQ